MEKFQNNYIVKKKPVKKKIHTGNSLAVHWLGPFTDKDVVSITGWETKILQSQKKKVHTVWFHVYKIFQK